MRTIIVSPSRAMCLENTPHSLDKAHRATNLKMSSSQQDPDDGHWSVSAPWVFRKTEYKVSADVREDVLIIQVEDCLAADQWTGQFDTKRILNFYIIAVYGVVVYVRV